MSKQEWLNRLEGRDTSQCLALAALVASAGDDGRVRFLALLERYREIYLSARVWDGEVSEDRVEDTGLRDFLTGSVLPRLATAGWIANGAADGWSVIRAAPAWWELARTEREWWAQLFLTREREATHAAAAPEVAVNGNGTGSKLSGRGLTKSFKGRRVVDDVSVEVRQGEVVGFLGPNGAGKTTTFYILTGLIRPDSGRVTFDDEDITRWPMYRRARRGIGYLAQEPSIFRKMSVEENVLASLERRRLPRKERQAVLERMLNELSITHLRRSPAYSLSGGERRRLEITRALVSEPRFMLLDEPFAGVDPIAVHDIQTIVAGLRHRGIGVLITDHNVEQTLDIVDRAYILREGRVQAAGTVPELVYDEHVSRLYLGPTLTARLRARLEAGV